MMGLDTAVRIRGDVGGLVECPQMVGPTGDPKTVSEATDRVVETPEDIVLRRAVLAELVDDELAVADDR
jgi:hypothetical protein